MTETMFNDIINRYANLIHSLIGRMIGFRESTWDLAQDVFIRLWEKRDSIDSSRSVFTYLYKIAVNHSIDYLRKAKPLLLGDEINELFIEERHEGSLELSDLIQKCLDYLKPKQKSVFILRDLEGLEFEEIAQVLGMPVQNIRSNLHLARKRIRGLLEHNFEVNLEYFNDM